MAVSVGCSKSAKVVVRGLDYTTGELKPAGFGKRLTQGDITADAVLFTQIVIRLRYFARKF